MTGGGGQGSDAGLGTKLVVLAMRLVESAWNVWDGAIVPRVRIVCFGETDYLSFSESLY